MSIADKLAYLNETKRQLREAINKMGGSLTDADPFRDYVAQLQDLIWNPDVLFRDGEQGAWYDPSDLSTLFQDAAGTTPVTADGDPVGLMLDKSQGMARGPELLQNSGFDDGLTGWDYIDTATEYVELVDGGVRLVTNSFQVSQVTQTLSAGNLAGKLIEISADVSGFVGGARARIVVSGSPFFTSPQATRSTEGKLTLRLAVPQGTNTITVSFRNIGGGPAVEYSFLVDSVSTRVLSGNHASQAVSADRPQHRTDGSLYWLQHGQVGDNLAASLPDLGTNATLAYTNAVGVTILEGQTISGATTLPQEAELYGAIYLDRPLTASETAQVTDYLNKLRGA